MSLETWEAEFYPLEARDVPVEDAKAHSLRKWIGLRKENLDKHSCWIEDKNLLCDGEDVLVITGSSCALCIHYVDDGCECCPLAEYLGWTCDDCEDSGPYTIFMLTGQVEPMIEALEAIQ